MSGEKFEGSEVDRLLEAEFTGFLYRVSFEGNRCQMIFTPFHMVLEVDAKVLLSVDLLNPKFAADDVDKEQLDEVAELKVEGGRLLVFLELCEDPIIFHGAEVSMKYIVPDALYFQELAVYLNGQNNANRAANVVGREKLEAAEGFLQKAIDRAERKFDFKDTSAIRHELGSLRGALRLLKGESDV